MNEPTSLHVVFGSGQIGPLVARDLVRRGQRVRVVRRSAPTPIAGAEVVRANALDAESCREATRGASVVYHCMNPAYSTKTWRAQLPALAANLV